LGQVLGEQRIEKAQDALVAGEDLHFRAERMEDARKLDGDITATCDADTVGSARKLEEPVRRRTELGARDSRYAWVGPCRDHDVGRSIGAVLAIDDVTGTDQACALAEPSHAAALEIGGIDAVEPLHVAV